MHSDNGLAVAVQEDLDLAEDEEKLYKVVFHNDNTTPIEFVVYILIEIFGKSKEDAIAITTEVHTSGTGIAGVYTFEVATTKTNESLTISSASGFNDFRITVEEE